jgi:hypothetical protein
MIYDIPCQTKSNAYSNIATECPPSIKRSINGESKRPMRRKVRFGPSVFFEASGRLNDETSQEDERLGLWWNRDEFDLIMSTARVSACEARHHPIVAGGLDQAFQLAVRMASLLGPACQLDEHLQKMQEEQRGLKIWCNNERTRRGLEKFTSRQYNHVRRTQRDNISKRVLALSKQGASPDEIRLVSERSSRVSIIFARMLAIADAKASKHVAGRNDTPVSGGKKPEHPIAVVESTRGLTRQPGRTLLC